MRIGYKEGCYILFSGSGNFFQKYCCAYYLIKNRRNRNFTIIAEVKIIVFMLLFIPISIILFFEALWDCGIKNFEFPERTLYRITFDDFDKMYDRMKYWGIDDKFSY